MQEHGVAGSTVSRILIILATAVFPLLGTVVGLSARAETIQQYAAECDTAMGNPRYTVPQFRCDDPASSELPMTNPKDRSGNPLNTTGMSVQQIYQRMRALTPQPPPGQPPLNPLPPMSCDRPNRLNKECDPGSRFRVLLNNDDAFLVALCRKKGNAGNTWGDIAVIQHNKKNGATCFYQEGPRDGLLNDVKAPSDPSGNEWNSPAFTASQACGGCHDSGPVIRSPYITQLGGSNKLPGADEACSTAECQTFNDDPQKYAFVGPDFASWKAFEVKIPGNRCNECHRMGVNNVSPNGGTALDFGIRATQQRPETAKNPHSAASPL
jgi:hypothetical protein